MVLGTRFEFRKSLMCCQGDFDKLSVRFEINLVSSLIVIKKNHLVLAWTWFYPYCFVWKIENLENLET